VEYCKDQFWGLLLFMITLNNIVNYNLFLFADDTKMYCH